MKQSMVILLFRMTSLVSMAFASLAFSADDIDEVVIPDDTQSDVTVGVYARHSGGKIAYHYRVVNHSQQSITAITIGRNNQNDVNPNNDVNELHGLPAGWNSKLGIPATSANSPTGWRVSVIAPEESENHAIAWETVNDRSPRILAGQTMNKLSIALDKADSNYLTGHALITYSNGDPINLTVPLERLDSMAPSFAVSLSPDTLIAQNVRAVTINASFTIKDDFDRFPEIKLESITANEPLEPNDIRDATIGLDDRYFKFRAISKSPAGRIYTVTYSATDASGNQALASATVTVIAPQGQNEQEKTKVEIK